MSFNICVVGCGGIAQLAHGAAYRKYADLHDDAVLTACCDIDEKRADSFKNEYGFLRAYSDYRQMLDTECPDAVCLNAPTHLTATLSAAILKKGYPLLLEKPPGVNKEELLMIIDAAEKSKAPNMVAFNRRFVPLIEAMLEKIAESRACGGLQNISCEFFRVGRTDDDFTTTSIHGIDAVRHLAGEGYKSVEFFYQTLPQYGEHVHNMIMQCEFTSGASATLRFLPMSGVVIERYTVNTGDKTLMLNLPWVESVDIPGRLTEYTKGEKISEISGADLSGPEFYLANGFYRENEVFFDTLQNGGKLNCDLYSAIQAVEIADHAKMKSKTWLAG